MIFDGHIQNWRKYKNKKKTTAMSMWCVTKGWLINVFFSDLFLDNVWDPQKPLAVRTMVLFMAFADKREKKTKMQKLARLIFHSLHKSWQIYKI